MSDWKQNSNNRRDFRRGKVENPERPKKAKKSSKKPWLIQSRFTGRWVEHITRFEDGVKTQHTYYDEDVSDWHKNWNHKNWKTEKRFAKERDAITCFEDAQHENKYSLMKLRKGSWEYRIITEYDFKKEKQTKN